MLLTDSMLSFLAGRIPVGISAADRAVECVGDPPEQWAVYAHCSRLTVELVLRPASGLEALDRVLEEVVPKVPSPEAGAFVVAERKTTALVRLRRYAEAAELCTTALATAPRSTDAVGHIHWSMQSSAMLAAHLAGRPDLAAPFVPFQYYEPKYTWLYPFYRRLGESLHVADTRGLDEARAVLVDGARSDERTRLPQGDSAYVTGFARLAQLEGDHGRALDYLRHTRAFIAEVGSLAAEVRAAIEGWSAEEFPERAIADIVAGYSEDRRRQADKHVLPLLHAEMARWSHLVDDT